MVCVLFCYKCCEHAVCCCFLHCFNIKDKFPHRELSAQKKIHTIQEKKPICIKL